MEQINADTTGPMFSNMTREEFVYRAALFALQGSFANSTARATTASLVREADALWQELQEWQQHREQL